MCPNISSHVQMDKHWVVADQPEQVFIAIDIFNSQRGEVWEDQGVFLLETTTDPQCLDKSAIHVTVDSPRWMRFLLCELDILPDLRQECLVPHLGNSHTGKKAAPGNMMGDLPKDVWYIERVL